MRPKGTESEPEKTIDSKQEKFKTWTNTQSKHTGKKNAPFLYEFIAFLSFVFIVILLFGCVADKILLKQRFRCAWLTEIFTRLIHKFLKFGEIVRENNVHHKIYV